jgi:hypothetical protein
VSWIAKLFSSDDQHADSMVLCGVFGVLGLIGLAFYQVAQGHPVGITEAGAGLAAVIGAAGAVRVGRDKLVTPPQETTP